MLIGETLGAYRVLEKLGEGGMGEVYRARDTRLHRDVALKFLLPALTGDPGRAARFAREARVLASLNHPHIAQVHGFEDSDGVRALVMELVEGPTLADRLARGPLPIDEALAVAAQIAEALGAAHEQHIVHRDLKPANIKLRPDGTTKVLDFGLAKALDDVAGAVVETVTISSADVSMPGVVLGTPAYMAPEQAKGLPVDRRVDLWAFGCVLFEMLSGRRAFGGDSVSEVLARILERDPDWQTLPAPTPPAIHRLLHRCLEKDPKRRLDSAAAARLEIDDALRSPAHAARRATNTEADARTWPSARAWPWMAAAFVLVAGAASIALFNATRSSREQSSVPVLQNATQVTFSLSVDSRPTWSPDGRRLAYQSNDNGYTLLGDTDIWVAQIGSGEPVNLTKGSAATDRGPSWSPDGREIAFFSDRDGDWGVYVVASIGGNPRKVLELRGQLGTSGSAPQWSRDGSMLFVAARDQRGNVIITLPLSTLTPTHVVLPDHDSPQRWDLSVRPDGGRLAYVEAGGGNPEVGRLWTIDSSGSAEIPLTDGRTQVWSPTWSNDGRALFYVSNRGGTMDLWQQILAENGTPVGEPLAVTRGLGISSAAFSSDGSRLAFSRAGRVSNVWRLPILSDRPATWADALRVTSEHAYIEFVDVSPNGEQLAVSSDRRGNQDLWLLPSTGGEMTPLTNDPTPDWNPRWSPDGRDIAFYAYRSGNRDIWVMPSQGGPARQLTFRPEFDWFPSWSPDGRQIAFQQTGLQGNSTWIVDAVGGVPRFVAQPGIGEWSPDGQWLAIAGPQGIRRVARGGGEPQLLSPPRRGINTPRFSRDGQSLYYSVTDGPREEHGIWKLSLTDRQTSRLTRLEGPRGRLGYVFSADARYLYITWYEDDGNIWVMDVVADRAK